MQRLTASGILCNGKYRVPQDHQRFRSERPRTDSRHSRHGTGSSQYVVRSAIVADGQGKPR